MKEIPRIPNKLFNVRFFSPTTFIIVVGLQNDIGGIYIINLITEPVLTTGQDYFFELHNQIPTNVDIKLFVRL
jgi:hypothetical protein